MEKLDFGDEIEGDDDIEPEAGSGDVVSMGMNPEKADADPLSASSSTTTTTTIPPQVHPRAAVDLLGDIPVEDDDDEDFFSFKP